MVTKKMLDLFKRDTDPPEFYELYAAPAGLLSAGALLSLPLGVPQVAAVAGAASGVMCIGGIAGLANQETARAGNALGIAGVTTGVAAALGTMAPADPLTYVQTLGLLGSGGFVGMTIANKVGPSELPQTVAALHSVVGLAAVTTALGDYGAHAVYGGPDEAAHAVTGVRAASIFLADFIGGVTATGSVVAFAKLNGSMGSTPLALENRDQINMTMGGLSLLSGAVFLTGPSPEVGMACLGATTALSGALGYVKRGRCCCCWCCARRLRYYHYYYYYHYYSSNYYY